jgi:hypothetical protein
LPDPIEDLKGRVKRAAPAVGEMLRMDWPTPPVRRYAERGVAAAQPYVEAGMTKLRRFMDRHQGDVDELFRKGGEYYRRAKRAVKVRD